MAAMKKISGWWALGIFVGALAFAIAVPAVPAFAQASTVDPAGQLQPSYFGTRELRGSNLSAFKQWNGALALSLA